MKGLIWNLKNLLQFSGRESRGRFWPYTTLVVVLTFLVMGAGMTVSMAGMFEAAEQIAAEHPEDVTVTRGPGSYSVSISGNHPELMPDFDLFFGVLAVAVAIAAFLLAAAVARRLHDSGRAGWWGVPPLVFLGTGVFEMTRLMSMMMAEVEPADAEVFPLFGLIFINNMIYLAALGLLVIFLALPGTPGPNRYGDSADRD